MTNAELLLPIPEALDGSAKLWYNAMGSGWDSWGDFCLAARSHFEMGQIFSLMSKYRFRTELKAQVNLRELIFSVCSL